MKNRTKQGLLSEKEPKGHIPISFQETKAETRFNAVKLSICIALFILISLQLHALEELSHPILLFMANHRTSVFSGFLKTMGFFGFEFFFLLIPIICFAVSLDNNRRTLSFGFDLILLLIYTWLFGSLIKSVFARLRPYQLFDDIATPNDMAVLEYSFPSGHSTGSMICWTFLYDRLKTNKTSTQRIFLYLFTWILVFLASSSRVYFCVHFPHDIIGGWLLSVIIYRLYSDWNVLPSVRAVIGLFGIMIVTCIFSTTELLLHMPGLITCTAALSGIIFCLAFSKYLPKSSPLVNEPIPKSPIWKSITRVAIGCLYFFAVGFLKPYALTSILTLFFIGFSMSVWLFWLAPCTFKFLYLHGG